MSVFLARKYIFAETDSELDSELEFEMTDPNWRAWRLIFFKCYWIVLKISNYGFIGTLIPNPVSDF